MSLILNQTFLPNAKVGKPYFVSINRPNNMPFDVHLTSFSFDVESSEPLTWDEPGLEKCTYRYKGDDNYNKNEKVCLFRYDNAKEYKSVETLTISKIDKIEDQYNHITISGTPKNKGFLDVYF